MKKSRSKILGVCWTIKKQLERFRPICSNTVLLFFCPLQRGSQDSRFIMAGRGRCQFELILLKESSGLLVFHVLLIYVTEVKDENFEVFYKIDACLT